MCCAILLKANTRYSVFKNGLHRIAKEPINREFRHRVVIRYGNNAYKNEP